MKFRIFLSLMAFLFINYCSGQQKINLDDIKLDFTTYIFYGAPHLKKCNASGTLLSNDEYKEGEAPIYSTFTIHRKTTIDNVDFYVIKFKKWNTKKGFFEGRDNHTKNLQKALQYNYAANSATKNILEKNTTGKDAIPLYQKTESINNLTEEAYFIISKEDLINYAYIYNPFKQYEFSYGTIAYLARLRPKVDTIAGKWSTDLNLGLTAGIKKKIRENWSLSLLGGLSISKVTIDSISTRGFLKTTKSNVALTPSLNLLIAYKNFSAGFGIGMDWVNEDSPEVSNWIYNNMIFYAIGFGINIFQTSSDNTTTKTSPQN